MVLKFGDNGVVSAKTEDKISQNILSADSDMHKQRRNRHGKWHSLEKTKQITSSKDKVPKKYEKVNRNEISETRTVEKIQKDKHYKKSCPIKDTLLWTCITYGQQDSPGRRKMKAYRDIKLGKIYEWEQITHIWDKHLWKDINECRRPCHKITHSGENLMD